MAEPRDKDTRVERLPGKRRQAAASSIHIGDSKIIARECTNIEECEGLEEPFVDDQGGGTSLRCA